MVRRMNDSDLPAAAKLEELCFPDPWSLSLVKAALGSPIDAIWVIEQASDSQGVCGYGDLRLLGEEAEIMRIAVLPTARGRGYGKKLMETMVGFAINKGVRELTLEVRSQNYAAINLYIASGFQTEAVRKGYYDHPKDDALIMWRRRL